MSGFRGWPKGCPPFLVKFCIIFEEFLFNKIKSIYIAGKCPVHLYLNFLNPSLLIVFDKGLLNYQRYVLDYSVHTGLYYKAISRLFT